MNKYDNLLESIAQEFNIRKGTTESIENWKARIIYSVVGRMGYASLWDIQHDMNPTSIVHFKDRITATLTSYCQLYPEIKSYFPLSEDELSAEIYNIFLSTGCLYHTPFRIAPSKYSCALQGSNFYIRGAFPNFENVCGLGSYVSSELALDTTGSFLGMFQLQGENLNSIWNELLQTIEWKKSQLPDGAEFLKHHSFKNGYWNDKPIQSGIVSIFRVGLPSERLYYLYKIENQSYSISPLPSWRTHDSKYRWISNACLHINGVLPPIQYSYDGELVKIHFAYLPPENELNLIKLYSWPLFMNTLPCDFSRILTKNIFEDIKTLLENKGFSFIEV